ncbi:MAG: hypothetical protein M1832_005343 [Thelocarpon impressellum]|nr:MAG: hypothetical protein M1832_005343 [Thelocarpon impressellum]
MITRAMSVQGVSEDGSTSSRHTPSRRPAAGNRRTGRKANLDVPPASELPAIPPQQNFAYGTAMPELPRNLALNEVNQTVGNLLGEAVEKADELADAPSHYTRRRSKTPSIASTATNTSRLQPPVRRTIWEEPARRPANRKLPTTQATHAAKARTGASSVDGHDTTKSFMGEDSLFGHTDVRADQSAQPASHHQQPPQSEPERFQVDQHLAAAPTPTSTPHWTPLLLSFWYWLVYILTRLVLSLVVLGLTLGTSFLAMQGYRSVVQHFDNVNGTAAYSPLIRDGLGISSVAERDMHKRLSVVEQGVTWLRGQDILRRTTSAERDIAMLKTQLTTAVAHVDALMEADPALKADYTFQKVNFFSTGLGADVDPFLTSPTAVMRSTFLQRLVTRVLPAGRGLRKPKAPIAALQPWDDIGDCWCTPSNAGRAQIAVLLPRRIFPTDITVEHIPKTATLDIGSAPRHLELWAQVLNPDALRIARSRATDLWGAQLPDEGGARGLDETFVRVAKWDFNPHGRSHVQSHRLDVDMQDVRAAVDKVVLRTKGNWGAAQTCLYRARMGGVVAEANA